MIALMAVAALELVAAQKTPMADFFGTGPQLTLLYLVAIAAVCACAVAHRGGALSSALYMVAMAVGVSHLGRHIDLYSDLAAGDPVERAALALAAGLMMPIALAASPIIEAVPIARGYARGWL